MKAFVWVAGIAIPVVVALLMYFPSIQVSEEMKATLHTLRAVNAIINGATFLCLLLSFWAIKNGKVQLHQAMNSTALVLAALFLISYVICHFTLDRLEFCKEGWISFLYYFVLLTHILLSIVIVPLVLTTYLLGLGNQIQRHRKWARITWPIWMYVTFTGVVVYLLISPCYPF